MAAPSVQETTKRRIASAFSALNPKRTRSSTPNVPPPPASVGKVDRFRPWSREDLLARISTFKIHTWLVQSPRLSPVKCARNGWINVDYSKLKCTLCSAILIAEIPEDLMEDEETAWIDRLGQQLQSSHNAGCDWKDHECAASVYSVPLATSRETVDEICQLAASLLDFSEQFPSIDHPLTSFQSGLLRALSPSVLSIVEKDGSDPRESQVLTALILALFGWRKDMSISRPTIKCDLCFRSAGLWLFSESEADANASAGDDADKPEPRAFNVSSEHRAFCYWAYGTETDLDHNTSEDSSTPAAASAASAASAAANLDQRVTEDNRSGWKKLIASLFRAKAQNIGSYDTTSDSENESDTSSEEDKDSGINASAAMKNLKPFNISAISSAAEAFGIPFNTSILAKAVQRLNALPETEARQTSTSNSAENTDSSVLLTEDIRARESWDSENTEENAIRFDTGDTDASEHELVMRDSNIAEYEADANDIPDAPIDISGLESLLGDSSLADALEDPTRASAILEYIKGLIKTNNQANPPAIPTLFVARVCAFFTGAKLVIDWHNYGHTILGMKMGSSHPVVKLATCGKLLVLHDKAPRHFKRLSASEIHKLWTRLQGDPQLASLQRMLNDSNGDGNGPRDEQSTLLTSQARNGTVSMRKGRPMFLVSSTSWTADEDFSILLDALRMYDEQASRNGGTSLAVIITGKGPLREYYEAEIDRLKLSRVCIATAWLSAEDYPLLLGSADLGISLHTSSSGLDLPMKVVDMLGCGTPVCAYEFACIHELVDSRNGMVFGNASELAQQVQSLASQLGSIRGPYQRLLRGAEEFRRTDWETNYRAVLDIFNASL
ncbi:mannosyltransferase [Coemansia interrupta]|uniref:Chitobiosyldiphosphodolichol beta-mannosyltransferase n=1 Tax=Coemansia interrupta TaxID=1126814 RepID=A0A9W8HK22_9FUNG|nr:mannosyltransferase [Coemansia interrupta]